MSLPSLSAIPTQERVYLKELAARVQSLTLSDENQERRRLSLATNDLKAERPLILTSPERAWIEILPETELRCSHPVTRTWERQLRRREIQGSVLRCDRYLYPFLEIPWQIDWGNWGVEIHHTESDQEGGSHGWEGFPVTDIDGDLPNLRYRQPQVDRQATWDEVSLAQELFGTVLPVRIHAECLKWTLGLTWDVIELLGLENLMLAMYDQPEPLHRLMAWKRDEMQHVVDWMEREKLLYPSYENDNVGSGGSAFTSALPQKGWLPGQPLTASDVWCLSESQETVGVSPEMFEEFILPYQKPLTDRFGLVYYGCCEPLDRRIGAVKAAMPNLRKVSVSPWADQEVMAAELARDYVYCRKPNPTLVCAPFISEDDIRQDLRKTLQIAGNLNLEIILKDTHTIHHETRRITRWMEIAREEVERFLG